MFGLGTAAGLAAHRPGGPQQHEGGEQQAYEPEEGADQGLHCHASREAKRYSSRYGAASSKTHARSSPLSPLYRAANPVDLGLVTSLLEEAGIEYLIQGEGWNALFPGIQAAGFNESLVLVADPDLEPARALLRRAGLMAFEA
ncbi:MAG: DUF2007 domain-containing protein [Gammaproteobacteria bacterium]|nr:MAG: DUF2007 domain-containing protein [Gammaproteobacteria bacterium]